MVNTPNNFSVPSSELPSGFDLSLFRTGLIGWWKKHGRSYPWRQTRNPYKLLIAEVLLHRTRADQVAPIYQVFIHRFTNPDEIAAAPTMVRSTLAPLGLRWRVERLLEMNAQLIDRFNGKVPSTQEELLTLPGVGPYIAAAVECFSRGSARVVLDTNTVRIVGRLFCIQTTDGSRRSQRFYRLLGALLDPQQPREFNFALLDLGALVCTSRAPACERCPLNNQCCYGRARTNVPDSSPSIEAAVHSQTIR